MRVTWNCQGKLAVGLLGIKHTLLLDPFSLPPTSLFETSFPLIFKINYPSSLPLSLKVFPLHLNSWKDLFGRGSYLDRTVGAPLCQLDNL